MLANGKRIRDVESVIRASRALTDEIRLDKLVDTLMTITLEYAAAQRGLLIRLQGKAPVIEARAQHLARRYPRAAGAGRPRRR